MENIELIAKAMSMIKKPSDIVGNERRDLKQIMPEIVEHLVLEGLGVPAGSWAEQSARLLRPDCHKDDALYKEGMAGVYRNMAEIYNFVISNGGKETKEMMIFNKYLWMYQKTTEHLDSRSIKGICLE